MKVLRAGVLLASRGNTGGREELLFLCLDFKLNTDLYIALISCDTSSKIVSFKLK
jgi:hypothetical protein